MQYRTLGASGVAASAVALGTWGIGGGTFWQHTEDEQSIRAIRAAVESGITLLDTAPVYGFGHSEEVVGKAIEQIGRDKVILSTKCGLWWKDGRGSYFNTRDGNVTNRSLDPATIRIEIEDSLRRLRTDYIDLYHTHWQSIPPSYTPVCDTMAALLKLKDEGKIRAIGVSNIDIPCLDEYFACGPVDACQSRYSLLSRGIERDVLPYALRHNMAVLAYSPLERGLLTGKITMDTQVDAGSAQEQILWMQGENRARVLSLLQGWNDLCEKYACSMAQLVIAWTLAQPGVTHVLCGARSEANARSNAAAGDLVLQSADVARMRADAEALGEPVKKQ